MKFYNNNSFTYINIKKESSYGVMEHCRYYLNGKCLLLGRNCLEQKNCKHFVHTNSSKQDSLKYNKIEPENLKVKTIGGSKGVDYSKTYSITIYKIYSYNDNKSNYFYISNKDYEIPNYQRIDVGSDMATKTRKVGLYQDFVVDKQKYKLLEIFKHNVLKV